MEFEDRVCTWRLMIEVVRYKLKDMVRYKLVIITELLSGGEVNWNCIQHVEIS